jgi:hypothetical protein
MKDLGNDEFEVESQERIEIRTTGNKQPFLVGFQTPPVGSAWENITVIPRGEQREFATPKAQGKIVSFNVDYDEEIPANDPDPVARYTTVFTSLTNPGDPPSTKKIAVPKGTGPVPRFFKFTVK